ncbi:MAG: mucoidy inhibitor MuiA family protein [Maritimibacter sp.]
MRTVSLSLLALVAASPTFAKDYVVQAPATQVVVHPDGARVTYRTSVEVDAGTHRVMVAAPRGLLGEDARYQVSGAALTRGPMTFQPGALIDLEALLTSEQAEAKSVMESAETRVRLAQDALEAARGQVRALDAKAAYLLALGQPDEATAETLIAIAGAVGTELAATNSAIIDAKAGLPALQKAKDEAQTAYEAAAKDYRGLMPFHDTASADVVSVEVTQASRGPVVIEIEDRTYNASWGMTYDVALSTDTNKVEVDRKVQIGQRTGMLWSEVELTLSTSNLFTALAPHEVNSDQASVYALTRARSSAPKAELEASSDFAVSGVRAPVVTEAGAPLAVMNTSGPVITYEYPTPVTALNGENLLLDLDQVTLDADPVIHAAPRFDDTAFMVADVTNTSGAPLLPGPANISRDGQYMGATQIGRIPAGGAETIGFGPVEGIQLETIFVRNQEGDSGIISRSSTRKQTIRFTLENLTSEAQEVTAFFPITYSEQEDLRVRVVATPEPDLTDIDDKRGVSSWEVALAPGQKKEVRLDVSLDWPEGGELVWNP